MCEDPVIMVATVLYKEADVSPTADDGWFVFDKYGDAYGPFDSALEAQIFLEEKSL